MASSRNIEQIVHQENVPGHTSHIANDTIQDLAFELFGHPASSTDLAHVKCCISSAKRVSARAAH